MKAIELVAICIFLTLYVLSPQVHATTTTSDCAAVTNTKIDLEKIPASYVQRNFEVYGTPPFDPELRTLTIFTDKDLVTAARGLASYCCFDGDITAGSEGCKKVEQIKPAYYPRSGYYADHLMAVGMRKLDGIEEHCEAVEIDCQPKSYTIDPVQWRTEISDIAQAVEGVSSEYIAQLYRLYWGDATTFTTEGESSLYGAYRVLCSEVSYLDEFIKVGSRGESLLPTDISCIDMVNDRYNREYLYVKSVLIKKGMHYVVNDNLRTYLREYFLDTRMSGLVEKYIDMSSCFTTVLQYAQKTTQCND